MEVLVFFGVIASTGASGVLEAINKMGGVKNSLI